VTGLPQAGEAAWRGRRVSRQRHMRIRKKAHGARLDDSFRFVSVLIRPKDSDITRSAAPLVADEHVGCGSFCKGPRRT
jgi:hypothetical protein